jgi:hypothetical protein
MDTQGKVNKCETERETRTAEMKFCTWLVSLQEWRKEQDTEDRELVKEKGLRCSGARNTQNRYPDRAV